MNIIRINENIKNEKAYLYKSPIGKLFLYADISNKYLTCLDFNGDKESTKKIIKDEIDNPNIIKKAKKELDEYFTGKEKF